MKKTALFTMVLLPICALYAGVVDMTPFNSPEPRGLQSTTRERVCLNGAWNFSPVKAEKELFGDEFPDPDTPPKKAEWSEIVVPGLFRTPRLPAGACAPDGSPKAGPTTDDHSAWYKREFSVPADWQGKTVCLRFEAVAFCAKVFVNNVPVANHKGPLTPFSIDISDKVKYGENNSVAVYVIDQNRVSYCPPDAKSYARFGKTTWGVLPEVWSYRGRVAGIWQDVWLEAKPKVNIDDIFAMPSFRKMKITGEITVNNDTEDPKANLLVLDILDMSGKKVLEVGRNDIAVMPHCSATLSISSEWKDPALWDIGQPNLYYMRARLLAYTANNDLIDEKLVRFGFRETWVEGSQIYLNGRVLHPFGDWITDTGVGSHPVNHRYEYCVEKFRSVMNDLNFVCSRHSGHGAQAVYDAADDVGFGMMPTGYAGLHVLPPSFPALIDEWRDYIKRLRNHPCILIWSVQNESLIHTKTRDIFALQRALDQVMEETDPTRPYYHDGHAQRIPEDPGAIYENGDLSGNAPISGGHYTITRSPMSCWMHEFSRWRKKKPFIYGEAGTFGTRDIPSFVRMFYGDECLGKSVAELDEMGGRVVKMVVGSWRTYAVSGIMAHGTYQTSSYYANQAYTAATLTKFKWNDLNTPGSKPYKLDSRCCRFNPYEPGNLPVRPGVYASWMKRTYGPFLVSLQRDLRHNYFSGETAEKTAYLVNDTRMDVNAVLEWKLIDRGTGKALSSHTEDVLVTQGSPVMRKRLFVMPFQASSNIALTVSARTGDNRFTDDDLMDINVYERMPAPELKKQYYIHDTNGKMTALLKSMGVEADPLGEDTFSGDSGNKILIIAPLSFDDSIGKYQGQLDRFISGGGTVVIMNQYVDFPWTGSSNRQILSRGHPLFEGLKGGMAYFWAGKDNLIADCKYSMPPVGHYIKHIPDYYFEMKKGKGVLIGCNLLLVDRYGIEPEARLLFGNLLRYADAPRQPVRHLRFLGSEKTLATLTNLYVSVQSVAAGNVASLPPDTVLLVESCKDTATCTNAISKFVNSGGTLVFANQTDQTWDGKAINNEVALSRTTELWQMPKLEHDTMLSGMGSISLPASIYSAQKARYPFVVKPAKDSGWHAAFEVYNKAALNRSSLFKKMSSSGCYVTAWKDTGKGRIVLSQFGLSDTTLLNNLGVEVRQPSAETYLEPFLLLKESAIPITAVKPQLREKFHFVNLKHHANAVFQGNKFDASYQNVHFRKLPVGDWVFAGVPFHIVDSDNEEYLGGDPGAANSIIVLKGSRQPEYPEKAENIIVDRKARKIHFLHTSAWAISLQGSDKNPEYDTVTYRIKYKDGSTAQVTAKNEVNIRDWFTARRGFTGKLKESPAGWAEVNLQATYCYGVLWVQTWDNPHPEKEIMYLDVISSGRAVPLLFGVTLED